MRAFHNWASNQFGVLLWLPPILLVSVLIYTLGEVLDIPRLSVYWGSMWVVPTLCFGWNAVDGYLDARANEDAHVTSAQERTAWWAFRQDVMLFLASLAMTAAGFCAIFNVGPGSLVVALLFASGAILTVLALWNRSDRWAVLQLSRRTELRGDQS